MSQSGPRFTRRYNDAQKAALLKAVLSDGISTAEAVRRAASGDLGVPAFKLDKVYAYQLVGKGREAFEAQNPEALRLSIDRQIVAMARKALKMARALEKQQDPDPAALKAWVAALKAAQTGLARPEKPRAGQGSGDGLERPRSEEDVLGGLLAKAGNGRAGARD
jgi:hypothetical protein